MTTTVTKAPVSITIQPGQPGEGMGYNVHLPLPYPFHIDADTGDCRRGRGTVDLGEAPAGRPWRLLGFQVTLEQQTLDVIREEFVDDPELAVGKYPVFLDADGGFFNLTVPITHVTVNTLSTVKAVTS